MRKKQYVRRQIIKQVIMIDIFFIIAYIVAILIAQSMKLSLINDVYKSSPEVYIKIALEVYIKIALLIIAIISILIALVGYFERGEYEDEFDKNQSKKYVERRFLQEKLRFEVSLVNPKVEEYSEFFYDAQRKGFLHFYANLDDDDYENVKITSKLMEEKEKDFETIPKEDFLYYYQPID